MPLLTAKRKKYKKVVDLDIRKRDKGFTRRDLLPRDHRHPSELDQTEADREHGEDNRLLRLSTGEDRLGPAAEVRPAVSELLSGEGQEQGLDLNLTIYCFWFFPTMFCELFG